MKAGRLKVTIVREEGDLVVIEYAGLQFYAKKEDVLG